jgi:hypothetical protein
MKTMNKTTERKVETMISTKTVLLGTRTVYSRLIGALFLLAFVFYGVGNGLATSVLGTPDFLSTISAHQTTLVLGAFLMLLNSLVVVGMAVLFFPILETHGKRTALAYLASRIVEAILLAVGVLCLLMILPLAQHAVAAGEASAAWAKTLGSLAIQSNTMAYQIAEMSLGLGGVFLCSLLLRTRLIPRFLAGWGVVGYALFLAGAIAEILGSHIGLILSVPGGLFEVAFALWLIIKGFEPEAYGQHRDDPVALMGTA